MNRTYMPHYTKYNIILIEKVVSLKEKKKKKKKKEESQPWIKFYNAIKLSIIGSHRP